MSKNFEKDAQAHLDRAESLIWALLDDQIDNVETAELTKLLEEDAAVRAKYIDCVQLHVELVDHYGRKPATNGSGPVVLGHLFPGLPGMSELGHTVE